jgi:putative PEP-CTERM system TPR-repeat lipoprotein
MGITMVRSTVALFAAVAALLAGCSESNPQALLASGKDYLAKNDKNAAVIQFKNALQHDPKLAEARFLIGRTLLDTGDAVTAEKELRTALELKYPAEQVVPALAHALVSIGQYKQVIQEFSKTDISSDEGKAELQASLGKAYLAIGDIDGARSAYAAALAAKPKYPPALLGSAQLAAATRDYRKALTIVDSALAAKPDYADAWYLKGEIHAAQQEHQLALAAYRKSVEVQRDFVPGHSAIVALLVRENKLDEAAQQLEALKKVAPNNPKTLYLRALVAYQKRNFIAARQAIQQELNLTPSHSPSVLLAGAIEYELKSYAAAEARLMYVLQREPNNSLARRILVQTYLRNGEPGKALSTLTPVLDRIDKDAKMLSVAGETYMMTGDYGRAAEYYTKAAKLDPTDPTKRTARAVSLIANGETASGIRELEQIAAEDSDTHADLALIATHLRLRDYAKALKAIDGLQKKQPNNPAAHNFRGAVLLAQNDVAGARRSFQRALELNPTYFPAIDNLAKIDVAENKPEAAEKRFEALLAQQPTHLQALLALADLRARAGPAASEQVVELINKAISAHPTESAPRVALISYRLRTRDAKKALAAAQDAVTAMPNRVDIVDAAARAYQAAGDLNQAISQYTRLASLQPTSAQPYLRLADLHLALKDKDAAASDLRRALDIQPDNVEVQRHAITLDIQGGRFKQALAIAQNAQKQRPKDPAGYIFEGDVHAANKEWTEAAAAYRRGLKESASPDLAIRMHDVFVVTGDRAGANQFAAKWFKEHPMDSGLRLHLAQMAMLGKDYRTAAEHYGKLHETYPNNALVLNNLAWALAHIKDPRALEYAEQANKLAPDQPTILDTLGVLLVQKGDAARGVELLRKAAALAPQVPEIRLNLARAQIKAGQKEAARKELDELSKLGDNFSQHAEVKQLKQEL